MLLIPLIFHEVNQLPMFKSQPQPILEGLAFLLCVSQSFGIVH